MTLILASGSQYRQLQLRHLGIDFKCMSSDVDENPLLDESAKELAERLAKDKALKVQSKHPDACVIGADQVCTFGAQIFGKPRNHANAVKQLQLFSDNCVEFLTALCVLTPDGDIYHHIDSTWIEFRSLALNEINRYIIKEQPLDCAGAFKVESLGLSLFKSVESKDPSALMGLPLIKLSEFLRLSGYQIP